MDSKAIRRQDGGSTSRRTGILVIHGIGTENPYGTLDSFARGLFTHFKSSPGLNGYTMQTEWKQRGADPSHKQTSWTQAQIRFTPDTGAVQSGGPEITVAEYYWSPATKGRLKDLDVLTWLIRSALDPFRYLIQNVSAMEATASADAARENQKRRTTRRAYDGSVIVLREIFRFLVLYIPLLLGMVALGAFLETVPALPKITSNIHWQSPHQYIAAFAIVRLLVLYSLINFFGYRKWMRLRLAKKDPARRLGNLALLCAGLVFVALLVIPVWYAYRVPGDANVPPLAPWVSSLANWHVFSEWTVLQWIVRAVAFLYKWLVIGLLLDGEFFPLFVPLLSLGFAALIRLFFVDFLGDVAIYTNLNQRSANFATRAQILEECGHALTSLYLDLREAGDDFQILIAAHSLGTVIAYDTLNDLFNRARIPAPPVGAEDAPAANPVAALDICKRLGGLLTFGSPLNKTYYFFRDQSSAEELVRAQIIDGLHSFRLTCVAGRLAGAPIKPEDDWSVRSLIEQFRWLNIWSTSDVVSGKLFFYLPSGQIHRPYKIPFPWSHLRYWKDPVLYAALASDFLGIPAPQAPSVSSSHAHTKRAVPVGS